MAGISTISAGGSGGSDSPQERQKKKKETGDAPSGTASSAPDPSGEVNASSAPTTGDSNGGDSGSQTTVETQSTTVEDADVSDRVEANTSGSAAGSGGGMGSAGGASGGTSDRVKSNLGKDRAKTGPASHDTVQNNQDVPKGWPGGIGANLGPDNASGNASGDQGARENQIEAVNRTSQDQFTGGPIIQGDDGDIDPIPEDDEPDFDGDGSPGGNLTERNLPDVPGGGGGIPNPLADLEEDITLLLGVLVVAFLVARNADVGGTGG